ncbi:MAG: hypothetical protein GOMPHAMPRED_001863 [Gomphillus americanus]|uniref:Uncharacterized protein n=1 Tax=Gomphillus americanus TaxID=1940652 RepID=A0A8H3IG70_9LECA|nr:MAG: hypothetical protein GOMPHAMPRED_001863 [Gomphillus americanus]
MEARDAILLVGQWASEDDDVSDMATALTLAKNRLDSDKNFEEIVSLSLRTGYELQVNASTAISPGTSAEVIFSLPPIELLDILLDYGWDINSMGLPQRNSGPLLWRICHAPELVQWCIEHGARLTIPNETTSREPRSADIFHTPRHLLLLEVVARIGCVATFKKLHSMGAPLTPGVDWPKHHAPMVLHTAVFAAAVVLSRVSSSSSEIKVRVEMVQYLVDNVNWDVNGVCGGNWSAVIGPQFHCSRWKSNQHDIKRLGILVIANFLIGKGANIEFLLSFPDEESCSTPLGCLRHADPESFQAVIDLWRADYPDPMKVQSTESVQPVQIPGNGTPNKAEPPTLPPEVISMTGSFLELVDLKNIRLTSRLFSNSVFDHFHNFIRRKHITLTTSSLCDVIQKLQRSRLSCYVEEIVFSSPEVEGTDNIQGLLQNLLQMAWISENQRSLVVRSARRSEFIAIFEALYTSGLRLQSLRLYYDAGVDTGPVSYFGDFPRLMDLGPTLSSIRKLTWSLLIEDRATEDLAIIKQLLSMMTSVEVLNPSWYRRSSSLNSEVQSFSSCLDPILAMKLTECTLTGLYIQENSLRQFLAETSAKRITLDHIYMLSGTYETVFTILNNEKFDYFHLNCLQQCKGRERKRVQFGVPGECRVRIHHNRHVGPHEITREGKEATRKLEYHLTAKKLRGLTREGRQKYLDKMSRRCGFSEIWGSSYYLYG